MTGGQRNAEPCVKGSNEDVQNCTRVLTCEHCFHLRELLQGFWKVDDEKSYYGDMIENVMGMCDDFLTRIQVSHCLRAVESFHFTVGLVPVSVLYRTDHASAISVHCYKNNLWVLECIVVDYHPPLLSSLQSPYHGHPWSRVCDKASCTSPHPTRFTVLHIRAFGFQNRCPASQDSNMVDVDRHTLRESGRNNHTQPLDHLQSQERYGGAWCCTSPCVERQMAW